MPSVSLDADGDFVVVWFSDGSAGSDTHDYSVQGQRYTVPEPSSVVQLMSGILGLLALNLRRRHRSVCREQRRW